MKFWRNKDARQADLTHSGGEQNGRRFSDGICECFFVNDKDCTSVTILLQFSPMRPINNKPELAQIMACNRTGDRPLAEQMMA